MALCGKRLSVESMLNLEKGCYFPPFGLLDGSKGKIAASLHDEPDRLCVPVPGSLCPSPQAPEHNAQILLTMNDSDGKSCPLEPRVILQKRPCTLPPAWAFPGDCTRD